MKTPSMYLFGLTLLLGLHLTRCSSSPTPTGVDKPSLASSAGCTLLPEGNGIDSLCSSNRQVDTACVREWSRNWNSTWKYRQGFGQTYPLGGITLTDLVLQDLIDSCAQCPTTRIYFGFEMIGSDSILSLLLTNVDENCNDVYPNEQSAALHVNPATSAASWIPLDSAKALAKGWSDLFISDSGFSTFAIAHFYNFTQETIRALTIEPDIDVRADVAVNPVSKNDIFFNLMEAALVHDILLTPVDDNIASQGATYNFALPCPRFCGSLNLLTPAE